MSATEYRVACVPAPDADSIQRAPASLAIAGHSPAFRVPTLTKPTRRFAASVVSRIDNH